MRGEPPHNIEDTAPGQVDDALTALRYWALMRPPRNPSPPTPSPLYDENRHPGFDVDRRRRKQPWEDAFGVGDGLQQLTSFEDGEPVREEPLGLMGEPLRRMGDSEWL